MALIVTIAAFLIVGYRERRRRGRRRRTLLGPRVSRVAQRMRAHELPGAHHTRTADLSGWILPLAALALCGAALAVTGFTSPVHRTVPVPGAYQQLGDFSYVGQIEKPNAAYPSGLAVTGQPLLLNLFNRVSVRFHYQFNSRLPHRIRGTIELKAQIAAQTSWHQTFVVKKATAFTGDSTGIAGAVDLRAARAFLDGVSAQSGAVGADYDVNLVASVHITGFAGSKRIDETFAPILPFTFNHQLVKLKIPTTSTSPGTTYNSSAASGLSSILIPHSEGSVPRQAVNRLSFARMQLSVLVARWLGALTAAIALAALYVVALRYPKHRTRREHEQIEARYGRMIVPAVALNPDGRAQVELPDFVSLARLARHYEQLILHEEREGRHTWAVDEDGRLYTYSIDPAARAELAGSNDRRSPLSAIPALAAIPPSSGPRTRRRLWLRPAGALGLLVLVLTLATTLTASNTVPVSHAGKTTQALAPSQLLPAQCSGIAVTNLIVVAASASSVTGTSQNDLILGQFHNGNVTYNGGGGEDCMVGGAGIGTKTFSGGSGNDVCIGAPGARNAFTSCSKTYN